MIKRLIRNIFNLLIIGFAINSISASISYAEAEKKPKTEIKDGGVFVSNISSKELEATFANFEYNKYIYMPGWKYPPIFLEEMPYDFPQIEEKNTRINLFIRAMIPLALKVNENILFERLEFIKIRQAFEKNMDLNEEEKTKLEALAEKYDAFTKFKGLRRYNRLITDLDQRINIIPPSILIANAAIETDWGASKPLMQGNSLYKELVWYTDEGLDPEDPNDKTYRIKTFPTLYDSMTSFAHKINSNVNYEIFRHARATVLKSGKNMNGRMLAHNMYYNSNLKNFIGLLNYTITFYELTNIDKFATLGFPKDSDRRL